jgi:DNA mismatch repair protein MutS2
LGIAPLEKPSSMNQPTPNQTAERPALAAGQAADIHTLAVLELAQLLEHLSSLAHSSLGADMCRALTPCVDSKTVIRRQRRLVQLRDLLDKGGYPSLAGLEDLRPYFNRMHMDGGFLLPAELEMVADFISVTSRAASFLDTAPREYGELNRLRNRITPLPELGKRLREIVGPGQMVRSSASPELARIRKDLGRQRDRLRGQLNALVNRSDLSGVFSDQIVTQRADRFVVPIKTDAKGRLNGIIHDTSQSGATCFVEPLEVVEDNNQLAMLRQKEREEEERVLKEITRELFGQIKALTENMVAVAQLDCLLAQAAMAEKLSCSEPLLATDGGFELLKARHPLLAWRQASGKGRAVPIEVRLEPSKNVLVISGANAGGKTATLKTVGLIHLMALCGLQVPCLSGSKMSLYRRILAEVGDDQSLENDLSTFTAHAGRLAEMIRLAGEGTLVLVDELGTGTDPGEGAALAMAFLDWLVIHGAKALCTTHFHRLKAYAAANEGVENVSVAFDKTSGEPTFQLSYGRPGFSDALAVSRGLGFPPEVITKAESLVDSSERQTVALLQEAEAARQAALALKHEAHQERAQAMQDRQEARELFKAAKKQRAKALDDGKRRVREVARRMEKRLENLWRDTHAAQESGQEVKPGRVRQEFYAERRDALSEVGRVLSPPKEKKAMGPAPGVYDLKSGDRVRLINLGQEGVLAEDARPGLESLYVNVGKAGVRVQVNLNEMEPLGTEAMPKKAVQQQVSVLASAGDGLDLNVIGLTVDDALPLLDKAIDQALLAGRNSLTVVHGVGTGRLRAGVRDYLARHPQVVQARPGQGLQSNAVTVAQLRD